MTGFTKSNRPKWFYWFCLTILSISMPANAAKVVQSDTDPQLALTVGKIIDSWSFCGWRRIGSSQGVVERNSSGAANRGRTRKLSPIEDNDTVGWHTYTMTDKPEKFSCYWDGDYYTDAIFGEAPPEPTPEPTAEAAPEPTPEPAVTGSPEIGLISSTGASLANNATDNQGICCSKNTGTTVTYTIQNTGNGDLNVSNITSSNTSHSFVSSITPATATIPANGQASIAVAFTPTEGGMFGFDLNISSDDADEGNYRISFSGMARAAPPNQGSGMTNDAGGDNAPSGPAAY